MAHVIPTYADFIARFPVFADRSQAVIEALITEAAGTVDTDWLERDYAPAILYLTAHLLANEESEAGDDVDVGTGVSNAVASESFGGMSISYAAADDGGSLNDSELYGNTEFGRRFLRLLRLNKPAVVIV